MNGRLAEMVRRRAASQCEYCRLPADFVRIPFEIEHIIPRQHHGSDAPGNLAFTCLHCNKHKGPNISGFDRFTSRTRLVRLFHPRRHRWDYHFQRFGATLVGRTPIGRATVDVLAMNDPLMVALREELIAEGVIDLRGS